LVAKEKRMRIELMANRETPSIERRQLLQCGLAAAVAIAWDEALAIAPQAPTLPFGYSLYGMKTLPLERALATCAEIGYDTVELASMDGWPADPATLSNESRRRLSRQLNELNLSLAALMENLPLDVDDVRHRKNLDRLQAAADLAHALAGERAPPIETVIGGQPGTWDAVRERFAARLTDWERMAAKTETVVAIKPHRFGAMSTPEQALWLLERTESRWIRLVYDYSHFQHREFSMVETVQQLTPSSVMIHIKDTVIEDGKPKFVLPGEGGVDYDVLLRQAAACGFSGPICVEVSGMVQNQPGYDAIASAKRAYQNIAPAFAKAGISRGDGRASLN
jgi:sugar phosphate isomerase/epimerase